MQETDVRTTKAEMLNWVISITGPQNSAHIYNWTIRVRTYDNQTKLLALDTVYNCNTYGAPLVQKLKTPSDKG